VVAIRYTARLGGVDGLCVMLMDVLSGLDEIKICTAYEIDGKRTNVYPSHVDDLRRVKPIYESVPGWKEEIDQVKSYDELPAAAHAYLDRIAELVGCPVDVVSVGPGREQTIVINESLTRC
jgi:adenylosuccinate synthase